MVQLIPPEIFLNRWKSSDVFLFSRSNRNDRKIPVLNSQSTLFALASFPAFRHCRCSRHFDLLLFSYGRKRLGSVETPYRENPVPLRLFHSNRIFRANGKRPQSPEIDLVWTAYFYIHEIKNFFFHFRAKLYRNSSSYHTYYRFENISFRLKFSYTLKANSLISCARRLTSSRVIFIELCRRVRVKFPKS